MATTSTPHPLRSLIALRYLETLSVTSGLQLTQFDHEGDVETYCRQFELCSAFLSRQHVNMAGVADLYLDGMPYAMVDRFRLSRFWPSDFTLKECFSAARSFMNALSGRCGRITKFDETGSIDRLLQSMEIKTHPETHLDSNFAFEKFLRMLKESTNDELLGKLEEFEPQGVQHTPSASSVADTDSTVGQDSPSGLFMTPAATIGSSITQNPPSEQSTTSSVTETESTINPDRPSEPPRAAHHIPSILPSDRELGPFCQNAPANEEYFSTSMISQLAAEHGGTVRVKVMYSATPSNPATRRLCQKLAANIQHYHDDLRS